MPPYSQMPTKQRTKVIAVHPTCNWCGIVGTFKCKGCAKRTCLRCLVNYEYGKCTHHRADPVATTGWGIPCVSADCGEDCNLCDGRGMIWSKTLLKMYAPQQIREAP